MLKKLVMVLSGKGGVGKTLVAINTALALSQKVKTALIDSDFSNANCAELLGVKDQIQVTPQSFTPLRLEGVEFFTMESISQGRAVAMHASEYAQILSDVLRYTDWTADIGVLDMPATITDTFLETVSTFGESLAGSIIVVQPAHVETARRLLQLHRSEGVPVLGVIENMSHFSCPKCGETYKVFGDLDLESFCKEYGVEPLGSIPLSMEIRESVVKGRPLLTGTLKEPIDRAVDRIIQSEPVGVSFVERLKERMKGVAREVIIEVLAAVIEISNTEVGIPQIQRSYGFKGGRTVELNIADETLRKIKLQAFFRVEDGLLKLVRRPEKVDDEIRVWERALVWSFIGRRPDTDTKFDLMDAWLQGKVKYYSTSSGTPTALQFMRHVWDSVKESPSFTNLKPILEKLA